jgi:(p)ppGpp synthase/HD superfamily hydrolase
MHNMANRAKLKKSTLLQRAISLAVAAHAKHEDPPGEPYIVHPLRVMLRVSSGDDAHQNEVLRCVAILHDVLERTDTTSGDLGRAGMPPAVIDAVSLLTHGKDVSYADYIVELEGNALARAVKIADLLDNADLKHVTLRRGKLKKDVPRLVRYAASYQFLTDQIDENTYRKLMKRGVAAG